MAFIFCPQGIAWHMNRCSESWMMAWRIDGWVMAGGLSGISHMKGVVGCHGRSGPDLCPADLGRN